MPLNIVMVQSGAAGDWYMDFETLAALYEDYQFQQYYDAETGDIEEAIALAGTFHEQAIQDPQQTLEFCQQHLPWSVVAENLRPYPSHFVEQAWLNTPYLMTVED